MRFEHSVCRGSLMTTYIMLLTWLVKQSLVHWYQQCVAVHCVPKHMSFHKAILVITGRVHCFHDCIYITHLASVRFEHSVCHESLTTTYIYIHTYIYKYIYIERERE